MDWNPRGGCGLDGAKTAVFKWKDYGVRSVYEQTECKLDGGTDCMT